jgi:hypothetical protein
MKSLTLTRIFFWITIAGIILYGFLATGCTVEHNCLKNLQKNYSGYGGTWTKTKPSKR